MAEYETVRDAAGNPVVVERRRGGGGIGWLVVLVIIAALVWAAFHYGLIGSSGGSLPTVAVSGGEAPKITTGSIDVGSKTTTVETPTVTVNKAPDAKN
ncbi:hypothetical protein KX816_18195 [Sphingosinicellaceae bacterium]|nr:hypothetical protein KX816_18195 [Sphingosinicellaceae bacterium]